MESREVVVELYSELSLLYSVRCADAFCSFCPRLLLRLSTRTTTTDRWPHFCVHRVRSDLNPNRIRLPILIRPRCERDASRPCRHHMTDAVAFRRLSPGGVRAFSTCDHRPCCFLHHRTRSIPEGSREIHKQTYCCPYSAVLAERTQPLINSARGLSVSLSASVV